MLVLLELFLVGLVTGVGNIPGCEGVLCILEVIRMCY